MVPALEAKIRSQQLSNVNCIINLRQYTADDALAAMEVALSLHPPLMGDDVFMVGRRRLTQGCPSMGVSGARYGGVRCPL